MWLLHGGLGGVRQCGGLLKWLDGVFVWCVGLWVCALAAWQAARTTVSRDVAVFGARRQHDALPCLPGAAVELCGCSCGSMAVC